MRTGKGGRPLLLQFLLNWIGDIYSACQEGHELTHRGPYTTSSPGGSREPKSFGMTLTGIISLTRRSGLSLSGVSQSVKRGEELANARGYRLIETMKLQK